MYPPTVDGNGRRDRHRAGKEKQLSASTNHSGILVGVDGSPASRYAVNWAARDAAMRNVPLTIVHAVRAFGPTLPPTPQAKAGKKPRRSILA